MGKYNYIQILHLSDRITLSWASQVLLIFLMSGVQRRDKLEPTKRGQISWCLQFSFLFVVSCPLLEAPLCMLSPQMWQKDIFTFKNNFKKIIALLFIKKFKKLLVFPESDVGHRNMDRCGSGPFLVVYNLCPEMSLINCYYTSASQKSQSRL